MNNLLDALLKTKAIDFLVTMSEESNLLELLDDFTNTHVPFLLDTNLNANTVATEICSTKFSDSLVTVVYLAKEEGENSYSLTISASKELLIHLSVAATFSYTEEGITNVSVTADNLVKNSCSSLDKIPSLFENCMATWFDEYLAKF